MVVQWSLALRPPRYRGHFVLARKIILLSRVAKKTTHLASFELNKMASTQ